MIKYIFAIIIAALFAFDNYSPWTKGCRVQGGTRNYITGNCNFGKHGEVIIKNE